MIPTIALGEMLIDWGWLIILGIMAVELVVVFGVSIKYHWQIVPPEENVGELASNLRGHALTLAGLTFTAIAVLVGLADDPMDFAEVLEVLSIAVGLLLLSFEVKELTRTKRVWFTIQEKSLAYGYMALFVGVILLYYFAVPGLGAWLLTAVFAIVVAIRFSTVVRQIRMFRRMEAEGLYDDKDKSEEEQAKGKGTESEEGQVQESIH